MMAPVSSPRKGHESVRKPLRSTTELTEQFGLEIPRQLQWHNWHAASEFIKVLLVKNVSTQVLRVTYKLLRSSSVFSVDFPETYKLSPGMVANIKVYFRPPNRQSYRDQLELFCGSNSICIPLEAVLPTSKLQLPSAIDFGCVPTKEPVVQRLPIKNVGDALLQFTWKLEQPFAIVPAAGQLAPGQTLICEVHFSPEEAAAYRVSAACSLDNGELLTVQIDGMAKIPFLSIEQTLVDFGDVVVGLTSESQVRFGNHPAVPANFTLTSAGGSNDGVFSLQPTHGTLQPNSYSTLQIVYSPKATGTFSCQTFTLSTPGGNKVTFTCQGTAVGPQLRLSSRVFSFGNVKAGQTPSKVLYLENLSEIPLAFEFLVEPNGVFSITRVVGMIPPKSMTHTALEFRGVVPANYWQRIVCLVKDSDPVAIDALATCYDDNSRPPPLSYKHVAAYLDRVAAGGSPVPDSSLVDAASRNSSPTSSRRVGSPALTSLATADTTESSPQRQVISAGTGTFNRSNTSSPQQFLQPSQQQQQQLVGPDSWGLLFDGLNAAAAVTVSETQLDFGTCSRLKPCEPRSCIVTNNTAAKLLVSVLVPAWLDPLGPLEKPIAVFQAFPDSFELRPGSSTAVRLAFRPPNDGLYYCQGIMLLARLKSMRSFRLVQEGQDVVPPWCINVLASGNTFAMMNPEFSPKVSLSSSSITFPPCRLSDTVHQTLALQNHGDTPVQYRFTAPGGASSAAAEKMLVVAGCEQFGPFSVLPSQGVLEPKTQHLVALRFSPVDLSSALLKLTCIFNNTAANSTTVLLSGIAAEPQLSWDVPDGKLFFRPTCVGAMSQRVVTVSNVSHVPVGWEWAMSRKLQDAVTVDPWRGVLRGFESVKVALNFAPVVQQVYSARAALLLLPPDAATPATAARTAAYAAATAGAVSITTVDLDESDQTALADGSDATAADQQQQQPGIDTEKLILTIVGEATPGALSVDPTTAAFGTTNVGYPQHKTLSLINQSNGVLRYSVELVEDVPDDFEQGAAACEFAAPTAALLAGASSSGETSKGALEDCWVDEADGIVNARSTKLLTLTLLPRRRGEYKYSLNIRASSLPKQQRPSGTRSSSAGAGTTLSSSAATPGLVGMVSSSPGTTALRHLSTADVSAAASNASHTVRTSTAPASAEEEVLDADVARGDDIISRQALPSVQDKPPLAVVAVTATAVFPLLLLTDVFCLGMPKQVSWQMLSMQQLNKELCSAVTTAELQAQALSDKGSLTNDNAAALLPPFEVDMGVVAAGQVARSFWVQFSNNGALPLDWELHSYDAPQVVLENWVEPARPLTQAEKERAFIIDNKIFDLHPHCGSLQPGQREQVCFTFNPVQEGKYQLPLFLRVKDGKQLQLQLNGRAVLSSAQLSLTTRGSQSCVLAPAPLGELEPPLQCYTLRNGGPAPLQYRLDTSPLQQLAKQNYGAEVIKYAGGSPLTGEVPVGDVAVLNWLFQPLEAKSYSVALPLSLGPAAPQPLLVRGRGYHPVQHLEEAQLTQEEAAQRWQDWLGFSAASTVSPPGRVLRINQEMLDLGVCLPASKTKRLLVLQNAAGVNLEFAWDLAVFEQERGVISGRLTVTPAAGVLEPGERLVCQVSFESGLAPQIFCGEMFCYARPEQTPEEDAAEEAMLLGTDGGDNSGLQGTGTVARPESGSLNGGDEEETIVGHPPRPIRRPSALQSKINNRLPLHLSMTKSARNKSSLLDQQYTITLASQKLTMQRQNGVNSSIGLNSSAGKSGAGAAVIPHADGFQSSARSASGSRSGAAGSWAVVDPQMLTVTLQGSVLAKEHVRSGSYIHKDQQSGACKLLEVAHLLPAVENPVSLLVPPGSMGISAASAKAAAAAAAAEAGELSWDGSNYSRPAPPAATTPLAAAAAVLQDIVGEVWADVDVTAALERIEPAPTIPATQLGIVSVGRDTCLPGFVDGDGVGRRSHSDESAHQRQATPQTQDDVEAEAAGDGGKVAVDDILKQPAFNAFAEYVLDSAIVGILQETTQQGLLEPVAQ